MKPLIYINQNQLQEFLNSKITVIGEAFEWKDEGIYHTYFSRPKIPPTCISLPCCFCFCEKPIEVVINDFINSKQKDCNKNSVVGIQFEDSVIKKAVIFDGCEFHEAEVKFIPLKSELYTRSKGLLEVDALEKKHVLIVGLGSIGSSIAVELAKAGVGKFTIVDYDRLELHNIARHICGVNELGRLKTNAVRDAILLKNPYAQIKTYDFDINGNKNIIEQEIIKADLTIAATDELKSRNMLNELLYKHGKTGILGWAVTRAEGGAVLRVRPDGPCYACLNGGHTEEVSNIGQARKIQQKWDYMTEDDINAIIQAGLSSDIAPINNMMVKLALLELSRGTKCEISSLDTELTYDYYMWVNRRENHYKTWTPFNSSDKKLPTILRWIGVKLEKDPECMVCNNG